ncbi:Putative F0F1-ATPase subunit Ca2+/Mg2+ transporter [Pustulibacterium marinum]|uniref:Putative F0F1-ATPase subunit Ca2+/Mg2+ transporter n=1 Tax=Pustulibacterium marinum TaxID=1224947 RepID=A0A1I7EU11_9FLAO|nr:AtpZ/AtpI family protein [Pustulibacterium marinum]SFU27378.1 Putative F0F1-ATPase subunit Ca2+/Mg2+ transporter [Pustulibacterium marinum]
MANKKPRNQLHKYMRFAGAGIQIGVIIFLFFKIGEWLDVKYHKTNELYTNILTLVGVFLSIYMIVKEALKLGKDE